MTRWPPVKLHSGLSCPVCLQHFLSASLGTQEAREQMWVDQGDHGEPRWESEEEEKLSYFFHAAPREGRPE